MVSRELKRGLQPLVAHNLSCVVSHDVEMLRMASFLDKRNTHVVSHFYICQHAHWLMQCACIELLS